MFTDMLQDPLFHEGRRGAVESAIRAAFSVPVIDADRIVASLACHLKPHAPAPIDIERNEVFAKLIAIFLHGRQGIPINAPFFASVMESVA